MWACLGNVIVSSGPKLIYSNMVCGKGNSSVVSQINITVDIYLQTMSSKTAFHSRVAAIDFKISL